MCSVRHKLMSARLSREMRNRFNVRSMPVRRDDEVCSGPWRAELYDFADW